MERDASLEHSLGAQVRRTERALHRLLQHHLAAHDVPVGMWYFLRVLWEEDGLSQRELAARVHATPAATAEQLSNMEARALLVRRPSNTDRRSKTVHLTEQGRALRDVLMRYPREIEDHAFQGLSVAETSFLHICLARIRRNLDEYEARLDVSARDEEGQ